MTTFIMRVDFSVKIFSHNTDENISWTVSAKHNCQYGSWTIGAGKHVVPVVYQPLQHQCIKMTVIAQRNSFSKQHRAGGQRGQPYYIFIFTTCLINYRYKIAVDCLVLNLKPFLWTNMNVILVHLSNN